jgi:hypothetical protein
MVSLNVSRKKDAFCEEIFRLISPRVTPVLRRHHRIIASRNLTELPDKRVHWLSAMVRGNGKKYLTLELSCVRNLVEDMCAIVSEFQSAKIGVDKKRRDSGLMEGAESNHEWLNQQGKKSDGTPSRETHTATQRWLWSMLRLAYRCHRANPPRCHPAYPP